MNKNRVNKLVSFLMVTITIILIIANNIFANENKYNFVVKNAIKDEQGLSTYYVFDGNFIIIKQSNKAICWVEDNLSQIEQQKIIKYIIDNKIDGKGNFNAIRNMEFVTDRHIFFRQNNNTTKEYIIDNKNGSNVFICNDLRDVSHVIFGNYSKELCVLIPTESPMPSILPTVEPTETPTITPTVEPTVVPSDKPNENPDFEPTEIPTVEPTTEPTIEPTEKPYVEPTIEPTVTPTEKPTIKPTIEPTLTPTIEPTERPTTEPTIEPTEIPTVEPTIEPTTTPTLTPTVEPIIIFTPTPVYTINPTTEPTKAPIVEEVVETTEIIEDVVEPTNISTIPEIEKETIIDETINPIKAIVNNKVVNIEDDKNIIKPINNDDTPKTDDSNNIAMYIALAIFVLCIMCGLSIYIFSEKK